MIRTTTMYHRRPTSDEEKNDTTVDNSTVYAAYALSVMGAQIVCQ